MISNAVKNIIVYEWTVFVDFTCNICKTFVSSSVADAVSTEEWC